MQAEAASAAKPRSAYFDALPGGQLVWIVFLLEIGTFALFFLGFAWQSRQLALVFATSQAQLHPLLGTLNTLVLLSGSWMAAAAVQAGREARPVGLWLSATGISGLVFLGIKSSEYRAVFAHGIRLSTNAFWFNYLFLTLLHFLHVVLGIAFMFYLAWRSGRTRPNDESRHHLEAAAIYWHLVDIIWVLLFPLIYFAHGGP